LCKEVFDEDCSNALARRSIYGQRCLRYSTGFPCGLRNCSTWTGDLNKARRMNGAIRARTSVSLLIRMSYDSVRGAGGQVTGAGELTSARDFPVRTGPDQSARYKDPMSHILEVSRRQQTRFDRALEQRFQWAHLHPNKRNLLLVARPLFRQKNSRPHLNPAEVPGLLARSACIPSGRCHTSLPAAELWTP